MTAIFTSSATLTRFAYCVLRIAYCVLASPLWPALRIAYCVLRIHQPILTRIAYCVLRIAYGPAHFVPTLTRIAYCMRFAYCVLHAFCVNANTQYAIRNTPYAPRWFLVGTPTRNTQYTQYAMLLKAGTVVRNTQYAIRKPCQTVLRNTQKAASIRNCSKRCVWRMLHLSSHMYLECILNVSCVPCI
jgi:hypothetical protein